MNTARKAIISDLRHKGLSGKEAYEATKKPEFIKQWLRIVDKKTIISDGKPKPEKAPSWIEKFLIRREEKARAKAVQESQKAHLVRRRARFIAKAMSSGSNLAGAEVAWKRQLEIEAQNKEEKS